MNVRILLILTLAVLAHPAYPQASFQELEVDSGIEQISVQFASEPSASYDLHYSTEIGPGFNGAEAVSPPSYENAYGNWQVPGGGEGRVQFLIHATHFQSVPSSHRNLIGFAWRTHSANTVTARITQPVMFLFATTAATSLLPSYGSNLQVSDGPELVYDGLFDGEVSSTERSLQDFEFEFRFDKPFRFDPSEGKNLLIDFFALIAADYAPVAIDGWQGGSTFTLLGSGGLMNRGFVTRFIFAEYDGTVAEDIPSQGDLTTYGPFANPAPDASKLFFAVETSVSGP